MNRREILTKILQVTGVTIVAFGGAFLHTGPPAWANTAYLEPVGGYVQYDPPDWGDRLSPDFAAAFGILVILLVIRAITWKYLAQLSRAAWLVLAGGCFLLFAFTSISYYNHKSNWTTGIPRGHPAAYYIVGDTLTARGTDIKRNLKEKGLPSGDAYLVDLENPEWSVIQTWTRGSIDKRTAKLWEEYTRLMALLSAAIFFLAEGTFVNQGTKKVDISNPLSFE
jgi:hypothetical protein